MAYAALNFDANKLHRHMKSNFDEKLEQIISYLLGLGIVLPVLILIAKNIA